MKFYLYIILIINLLFFNNKIIAQGPYAPAVGQVGTTAIHKDSSVFVAWATSATIERGWQNIVDTSLGKTTAGTITDVLGKSGTGGVVSLGDGGSAVLTFTAPIKNGSGADFAIFENSFDGQFLELAFVEVSSDGVNFFRFPAHSLTQDTTQLDNNANMDATYIHNLAGKYRAQYGTPFNLDDVDGTPGLDVNNITHVKIIDVVGSINPTYGTYDDENNIINDPFPTPFPTGGFDLDAVGIIHHQPTNINENEPIVNQIYPNPFSTNLTLELNINTDYSYAIIDMNGKTLFKETTSPNNNTINTTNLKKGIYFLKIIANKQVSTHKIIKL
ncbi:MAG: T9SS type A sorting domain-containing protein [Vicingaceae bacterium]|nr:T9SS type A sorting domain-containing protein [Vicingaceae bacterium]